MINIKLFADGANLDDMLAAYREGIVQGFTTNPTLMRRAGITDYETFARQVVTLIPDRCLSFEVFADDFTLMYRQAKRISTWGEQVYVKIPVTNTRGETATPLIRQLAQEGVKLNITAVLTLEQVRAVDQVLSPQVPAIVSVFAGRIADTGRDPMPVMGKAAQILKANSRAELLWASTREVLNIYQAQECGCEIITASKDLIAKLALRGKDLTDLSRETVQMFYEDARQSGFTLP